MATATNAQVQEFVNLRVRPRSEQIRSLLLAMQDDLAAFGDIYANVSAPGCTWTDDRTNQSDAPPHLLTPNDVLGWNAFVTEISTAMQNHPQLPVIVSACIRSLSQAGVTP